MVPVNLRFWLLMALFGTVALYAWRSPAQSTIIAASAATIADADDSAQDDALQIVTVAQGLEHPWSLAFLPDGSMLISERPGRLRHADIDGKISAPIIGTPPVDARGQGGLFDVLPDPHFASNRQLFFSYAEADQDGRNGLAVARATLSKDYRKLNNIEVIFRQQPKVVSTGHFGGRLVFATDGTLFITLGDRQNNNERGKAQHPDQHHGKIVRIRTDGSVPADNPFLKAPETLPEIWSLGHRNVQGAALHPQTGELWISEHGPQGGDEINVVKRGRNYGWPVITWGCEYGSCAKIGVGNTLAGMEQPVTYWVPVSTAPSGLAFYTGDKFPAWRGNLFSGALAGKTLWRLELDGERVVARHALLKKYGERLRDVRQGPDGYIYLLTDSANGRILRIEHKK